MPRLFPLALAVGALAASTAASPAVGASLFASGTDAMMAATTNASGAISWFQWDQPDNQIANVISRDGRFAYVAAPGTAGVLQYSRNTDTGALTPLSPPVAPHPAGPQIVTLTLAPDGSRLFATADDFSLFSYPIAPDGLLGTRSADVTLNARSFRMAPDGRTAYTAANSGGVSSIDVWGVDSDGAFTNPSSVYAQGVLGPCLAISPNGRDLYVPSEDLLYGGAVPVSRWAINPSTGQLTLIGDLPSFAAGSNPTCDAAVTSDGRMLVVAYNDVLRVWPIEADGSLGPQGTPLTWAAAGTSTTGLALHPAGIAAYATSADAGDVAQPGTLAQMRLARAGATILPQATSIPWQDVSWNDISAAPAQPPVAALAGATGEPGRGVRLDASASTDPDTSIARYDWQFGDGTLANDAGPRPEHVYAQAGDYTARVTVTNAAGCSTDPAGIYTGRMNSCIGGPSATTTATVRVRAASTAGGTVSGGGEGATKRRKNLPGAFALKRGVGTSTGTVPAGATSISQTARTGGSAATQGFVEMAKAKIAKGKCAITVVRNKKTKKVTKRTYRCTIRLAKGTWTVTTTARGKAGVVAEGSRRVVVR